MNAIEIEDLRKVYKEGFWGKPRVGLHGISFTVPKGKIFGFLGANGAGKTTAIKIALGLQSADAGLVRIFGVPSGSIEAKSRIGYLPERPYFHQNLKAEEFLNFHRDLYGHSLDQKPRSNNEELLKLVGLSEARNVYLRNFSKGMLQRVGIAQALVNDPELVILDEPMSGLDPVGRREVRNLLLDLNRRGKTIFFSSHILGDIEALCQQIAFLEKGKLRYVGSIEKLMEKGKNEYEILFFGNIPEGIERLGQLSSAGEAKKINVDGEKNAREVVQLLWGAGAEVKSFSHVHRNLEDVLFGEGGLNP